MPPEYRQEITAIVEILMKQVLDKQEALSKSVADLERKVDVKDAIQEARIGTVQDDIKELREEVRNVTKAVQGVKSEIIENQNQKYKKTIQNQLAIGSAILLPIIGYLVNLALQSIFHH